MRTSTIFFAGLAAVATAQLDPSIISTIPECAQAPLLAGFGSSGCQLTDTDCICSNTALKSSLTAAVQAACSADDQAKTLALFGKICPEQAAAAATSANAAATSAEAAASTLSSVADAATSSDAILTDSSMMMPTAAASDYPMGTGTGTATANLTATTGTYTARATPTITSQENGASQSGFGVLFAGLAGMAAFFVGL